jgi:hypothetical protein
MKSEKNQSTKKKKKGRRPSLPASTHRTTGKGHRGQTVRWRRTHPQGERAHRRMDRRRRHLRSQLSSVLAQLCTDRERKKGKMGRGLPPWSGVAGHRRGSGRRRTPLLRTEPPHRAVGLGQRQRGEAGEHSAMPPSPIATTSSSPLGAAGLRRSPMRRPPAAASERGETVARSGSRQSGARVCWTGAGAGFVWPDRPAQLSDRHPTALENRRWRQQATGHHRLGRDSERRLLTAAQCASRPWAASCDRKELFSLDFIFYRI